MNNRWSAPIDAYCERTSPDLWAEPINAWTNLAFIVAAIAAALLVRRRRPQDGWLWFLSACLAMIGAGSFVFHTVATPWAQLCDVVPIGVFVVTYAVLAFRRFLGLSPLQILGVGLLVAVPSGLLPAWLGGETGVGYVPALVAFIAVAAVLLRRKHPAATTFSLAAGTFVVSFAARTADPLLCGALPIGTHFVWHLLNAATLYLMIRAATEVE